MVKHNATMYYFEITALWPESQTEIINLIEPFATKENFALLYNFDPSIDKIYIATQDKRMILALQSIFNLKELESIDFMRDFFLTSNRQWGVTGNRFLVNF